MRRTDSMVRVLMLYSINTGALTRQVHIRFRLNLRLRFGSLFSICALTVLITVSSSCDECVIDSDTVISTRRCRTTSFTSLSSSSCRNVSSMGTRHVRHQLTLWLPPVLLNALLATLNAREKLRDQTSGVRGGASIPPSGNIHTTNRSSTGKDFFTTRQSDRVSSAFSCIECLDPSLRLIPDTGHGNPGRDYDRQEDRFNAESHTGKRAP